VHIPKEDRVKALKILPRGRVGRLIGYEGDHGRVYKVWVPETGEIERSCDLTFWENFFFWLCSEEKPGPIALKGPAVRVQYGNEETSQRQIEDRPTRHSDRLLESLEDINLETLFDFTNIGQM
jgi:hypothetical protein